MFFTKAALTAGPALLTSIPMVTCAGPVHFPFSCWTTPAPRLNSLSQLCWTLEARSIDKQSDEHFVWVLQDEESCANVLFCPHLFSLLLRSDSCSFSRLKKPEALTFGGLKRIDQGVWWHLVLIIFLLALSSDIIFLLQHMAKRHRRKRADTRQEEVQLNDPAHVEQTKPSPLHVICINEFRPV